MGAVTLGYLILEWANEWEKGSFPLSVTNARVVGIWENVGMWEFKAIEKDHSLLTQRETLYNSREGHLGVEDNILCGK